MIPKPPLMRRLVPIRLAGMVILAVVTASLAAFAVTEFGSGGVVLVDPTFNQVNRANSIAVDDHAIYVAGLENGGGGGAAAFNGYWRIEKRDRVTGELIPGFEVQPAPDFIDDQATGIVVDDGIYVVGERDRRWDIEKRDKASGALVTAFGDQGIVSIAPGNSRLPSDIAIDDNAIYLAGKQNGGQGCHQGGGNDCWRVEKRDRTSGALITAFDSDGVLLSNPTNGADAVSAIAVDGGDLYIAGWQAGGQGCNSGGDCWRVEKRDKTTGALISTFNSSGIALSDPTNSADRASDIVVDASAVYVAGWQAGGQGCTTGGDCWRIEKRDKTTGGLVSAFDADGVVVSDPGPSNDRAAALTVNTDAVFVTGTASSEGWLVQKLDKTTGASVAAFGGDGAVQSDPAAQDPRALSVVGDDVFVTGSHNIDSTHRAWRIEKRSATDGSLLATNPTVSWSVPSIEVTVERGTSDLASLTVTADEDATGVSVDVGSAISALVVPATQRDPFDIVGGVVYEVPMVFDVPTSTALGPHTGDVSIVSDTGQVMGAVTVTVNVVDPPTGVVPPEVSTPSRDRIGTDTAGQTLILDELVVGLDFAVADPEQRILTIANAHEGTIIGSVADAVTYQLWFPQVSDLDELESIRQSLAAEQDVDFASTHYLGTSLSAVPNDPLWDSWDEANPAGNNWNLEMINAPSAWDITTGDRSIPVAIIDADIDAEHEDLAANFDSHVGLRIPQPGSEGHGSHIAGIACAAGDNNIGVSGVAWDCSLRGYEFGFAVISDPEDPMTFVDFFEPIVSVQRMAEAASDGARMVNMSWRIAFGDCAGLDDPLALAKVEQVNDIWGRGVLFAEHIGQDVLWVAGAGNEFQCDARFISPASLTTRFPRSMITVASVNDSGELSEFSNQGEVVTVAAPGGESVLGDPSLGVFSTFRQKCFLGPPNKGCAIEFGQPYDEITGGSQAVPHVTGLAALVLSANDFSAAQTKACIVSGAEDHGIAVPGHAFSVIDAPSAVLCEGTVGLPPQVDLVFSLDLTGSMGQEIDQIKLQINEIMAGLRDAAPDTDFRFGVVSYEDYAGTFDSSVCVDSTYSNFYGGGSDEPFRIDLPLTGDDPSVATTINDLVLGGGGDGPQSYGRVFFEVSQGDTMTQLGFRPEALKLLVDFGDDVPHDADLNEGIEPPLEPPFPSPFDTGYDPGRNAQIDCGGDDIDFQDDAIPAMVGSEIHLVHIDSSGSPSLEVYWNLWASQTGGEFAAINSDGSVPEGLNLTQLIIELLQLIA